MYISKQSWVEYIGTPDINIESSIVGDSVVYLVSPFYGSWEIEAEIVGGICVYIIASVDGGLSMSYDAERTDGTGFNKFPTFGELINSVSPYEGAELLAA